MQFFEKNIFWENFTKIGLKTEGRRDFYIFTQDIRLRKSVQIHASNVHVKIACYDLFFLNHHSEFQRPERAKSNRRASLNTQLRAVFP